MRYQFMAGIEVIWSRDVKRVLLWFNNEQPQQATSGRKHAMECLMFAKKVSDKWLVGVAGSCNDPLLVPDQRAIRLGEANFTKSKVVVRVRFRE